MAAPPAPSAGPTTAAPSRTTKRLTMPGQVHKAYKVMLKIVNPKYFNKDKSIPMKILKNAKGIAFVTTIKGGFLWSGTLGSGIVIAKLPDGTWSGPSSLGVVGMGWGGQIGLSVTDSVIVLNNDIAVRAFAGTGQIKFGGSLSVAAGPLGREGDASAHVGDKGVAACYSYSHSRGLFAGISIQGAVLMTRTQDNAKFYGCPVKAMDIIRGKVLPPEFEDLKRLYDVLNVIDKSNTENFSFRDPEMKSFKDSSGVAFHGTPGTTYSQHRFDDADDDDDDDLPSSSSRTTSMGGAGFQWGQDADDDELVKAVMATTVTERSEDLEPGWVSVATEGGQPYYWHEQSGKTQWEKPIRQGAPVKMVPPPPVESKPDPNALPPGWVQVGSGDGKTYYWNEQTNVTQWERPGPVLARALTVPMAAVAATTSGAIPLASVATPAVPPRRSLSAQQPVNFAQQANVTAHAAAASQQARTAASSAATTAAVRQGVPPAGAANVAQSTVSRATPAAVASVATKAVPTRPASGVPGARPAIPSRPSSGAPAAQPQQSSSNPFDLL